MSHVLTLLALVTVQTPTGIPAVEASNTTLQNVFNVVLALAGAVAVAFIAFGGIKYTLSRGQPNEIKIARDAILYAAIGLVIVMASFVIVNFVIGRI